MRKFFTAAAAVFLSMVVCSNLPAPPAEPQGMVPVVREGWYKATGTDPRNGEKYHAISKIEKLGAGFQVTAYTRHAQWPNGGNFGVGMLVDGKLVVGWSGGDRVGVCIYTLAADGKTMEGVALANVTKGVIYRETKTWFATLEE